MIIADPDEDMVAKFWQERDIILNPYDMRTQGWTLFNEIRNEYDFKRYVLSIVPRGRTRESEEWASFARLLLREIARKMYLTGKHSMRELFRLATIATLEELREFLVGADAESLFAGTERALASARFMLADKLSEYVNMPMGDFSLRRWLEDPREGNLYITWREDMSESLKPLISAWIDILRTLPEDENRRLWMVLDELASLEKLANLENALTKGRKKGLRVVAGLQSTSHLESIYGEREAQILKSCFRSLVVLGGARTDPKTCEDMNQSLGEHEVEREKYSTSTSSGRDSKSSSSGTIIEYTRERVVLPSQIASLPDLTGYLALAGNWPIAKIRLVFMKFFDNSPNFQERVTKK